jgi:trans-aconitate methyltransferase
MTNCEKASLKYPGLQNQPDDGENASSLRRHLKHFLRTQFGRPTGFWGYMAGKIMAWTPSNQDRIRWTLSLLEVKPNDRLLEIGFGPGFAVELASKIASKGFVAGVDHSNIMLGQASRRNAAAIRNGNVELRLGSEPFDKIYTINSIHFWPDPLGCLVRLRELLKPGGCIAITIQPRSRMSSDETTERIGKEIAEKLEHVGFSSVQCEIKKMKPVAVACVRGVK